MRLVASLERGGAILRLGAETALHVDVVHQIAQRRAWIVNLPDEINSALERIKIFEKMPELFPCFEVHLFA